MNSHDTGFDNLNRDQLIKKWEHILDETDAVWSWTSGHEISWLCELASRSTSICEIGSHHGKSALCMALANPNCRIISVDNCENPEVERVFGENLKAQIASGQVSFVRGTSDWLKTATINPLSACFIDGAHTLFEVCADIVNLRPHMALGGIMTGHDYREDLPKDGVTRAVNEMFGKPNLFESIWFVRLPTELP